MMEDPLIFLKYIKIEGQLKALLLLRILYMKIGYFKSENDLINLTKMLP